MALEVAMTGTGTIGNIAPGWSVNESINAVAVGNTSAGTGSVSFNAQATNDSLLVINNDVISTVDGLGMVHGIVQSVSQTGINASITHGTVADNFNLDCQVEPVEFGGLYGWLYNMYCAIGLQERDNYLPSIASAGSSFPMHFSSMSSDYLYTFKSFLTNSTVTVGNPETDGQFPIFQAASPTTSWKDGNGLAAGFLPFMVGGQTGIAGSITATNSMVLQISTVIDSTNSSRIYLGSQFGSTTPSTIAYANCFTIDINSTTLLATVTELGTSTSISYDFSSLAYLGGNPLLFSFQTGVNTSGQMTIKMYVKDVLGAGGSTSTLVVNNSGGTNWGIRYDSFNGAVATINAFTTSITGDLSTYLDWFDSIIGTPFSSIFFYINYDAYVHYYGSYPATSGIAWELMQQLASAEHFEFSVEGDQLIVRNIKTYDSPSLIINAAGSPTISPTSTLSGRQINVSYNNAEFINGTIYDAEEDGNNIISVSAAGSTVTSVKRTVSPIAVRNPVRSDTWPVGDGEYYVIDSAGIPLLAGEWEDYGGSVSTEIDPEDNSAIRITVVGPYTDTTLAGGPYELAASDSSVKYAALKISGTGVYNEENLLGLITGVDPIKYTRATVNTINNPFIVTEENAYDRGVWATQRASGPIVSLNASIPTSSIDALGSTCGSLIQYLDSTYRITSCSIGNISTSITAERYVTVANVDDIWGTQTVADYDALWGNYECQDQIIFPYKVA